MVFLSKVVFANFKSANHVRFFQDNNTLNPEEPKKSSTFLISQRLSSSSLNSTAGQLGRATNGWPCLSVPTKARRAASGVILIPDYEPF